MNWKGSKRVAEGYPLFLWINLLTIRAVLHAAYDSVGLLIGLPAK